jgi:hypothetical protein
MTQPNPEMRKKVAEYVLGRTCMVYKRTVHACFYATDAARNIPTLAWEPANNLEQKDTLVRKIAELIEAAKEREGYIGHHNLLDRFNKALSTGSTNDLEALLVELLEAG